MAAIDQPLAGVDQSGLNGWLSVHQLLMNGQFGIGAIRGRHRNELSGFEVTWFTEFTGC
jgi:hypothetical protein